MLTIFTIPKPFKGDISLIQNNAIKSWINNFQFCEVILFGDDEGTSQISQEIGARHIEKIEKNEYGTPLLSDAFKMAQKEAKHDVICYINADIILLPNYSLFEIFQKVNNISNNKFLIVGQRINLHLNFPIDFSDNMWKENMKSLAINHGDLQPPCLIDYFIFNKGLITNMPQFAVGRPGWDNWMIYNAKKTGVAVFDVTKCVTAIHQNHDYTHILKGDGKTYEGIEADKNRSKMKTSQFLTIEDADWSMTENGFKRRFNIIRQMKMLFRILTEPLHVVYNHYHY